MDEQTGKYLIKYSNGTTSMMGETATTEAIATARKEGLKDPDLQLVEITDQGGCVIRWKLSMADKIKAAYWKVMAFLFLKFHRLISIGQTLG